MIRKSLRDVDSAVDSVTICTEDKESFKQPIIKLTPCRISIADYLSSISFSTALYASEISRLDDISPLFQHLLRILAFLAYRLNGIRTQG